MPTKDLVAKWVPFFKAIDAELKAPAELHCLGGFAIASKFGLPRATADVDFVEVGGAEAIDLLKIAGRGTELAKKHKLYLDFVTIGAYPEDYEQRLEELSIDGLERLRIKVFEKHDIVLAKLGRAADHDREDVKYLASRVGLDVTVLRDRFENEVKFQCTNETKDRNTLDFWIEMIEEIQSAKSGL
jgi:hypothetical protein